jgi:hypothetical protein
MYHVVSVTDPYGSILGFLDRSPHLRTETHPVIEMLCFLGTMDQVQKLGDSERYYNPYSGFLILVEKQFSHLEVCVAVP